MMESRWIDNYFTWETIHPPARTLKSAERSCARVWWNGVARRRDAHRRSLESSPRVRRAIRLERARPTTTGWGTNPGLDRTRDTRYIDRGSMLREIRISTIELNYTRGLLLLFVRFRSSLNFKLISRDTQGDARVRRKASENGRLVSEQRE